MKLHSSAVVASPGRNNLAINARCARMTCSSPRKNCRIEDDDVDREENLLEATRVFPELMLR